MDEQIPDWAQDSTGSQGSVPDWARDTSDSTAVSTPHTDSALWGQLKGFAKSINIQDPPWLTQFLKTPAVPAFSPGVIQSSPTIVQPLERFINQQRNLVTPENALLFGATELASTIQPEMAPYLNAAMLSSFSAQAAPRAIEGVGKVFSGKATPEEGSQAAADVIQTIFPFLHIGGKAAADAAFPVTPELPRGGAGTPQGFFRIAKPSTLEELSPKGFVRKYQQAPEDLTGIPDTATQPAPPPEVEGITPFTQRDVQTQTGLAEGGSLTTALSLRSHFPNHTLDELKQLGIVSNAPGATRLYTVNRPGSVERSDTGGTPETARFQGVTLEETDDAAQARANRAMKLLRGYGGDPSHVLASLTEERGQATWGEFADELEDEIKDLTSSPEETIRNLEIGLARKRGVSVAQIRREYAAREGYFQQKWLEQNFPGSEAEPPPVRKGGRSAKQPSPTQVEERPITLRVETRPSGQEPEAGSGDNVERETQGAAAQGNLPGAQPESPGVGAVAPETAPTEAAPDAPSVTPDIKTAKPKAPRGMTAPRDEYANSPETPIATEVHRRGGILSKSAAAKKGQFKGNEALWNYNLPEKLADKSHNKIFQQSGEMPDVMAKNLYNDGFLDDPSVETMYEQLKQESHHVVNKGKAEKAAAAERKTPEKQAERFGKAQRAEAESGTEAIPAARLNVGDKVKVDGTPLTVTDVSPDDGTVTLENGKRYGTQDIADGDIVYGEHKPVKEEEAPFEIPEPAESNPAKARAESWKIVGDRKANTYRHQGTGLIIRGRRTPEGKWTWEAVHPDTGEVLNESTSRRRAQDKNIEGLLEKPEPPPEQVASDVTAAAEAASQPEGQGEYDFSTPAGFEQAIRERFDREPTPEEKAVFDKISKDIAREKKATQKQASETMDEILHLFEEADDISWNEAVKQIHDAINDATKGCG